MINIRLIWGVDMHSRQETSKNLISIYSCDRLPFSIKDTIPGDYFKFAAKSINCRKGKFFTDLDDAKKYLNNQGTTHALHEITVPKKFFIEESNTINYEHTVKPEDIKNLYLSSYFYKRELTLTPNANYLNQNSPTEIKNEPGKYSPNYSTPNS